MVHVTCPSCQSRLNAPEKLAGQTRNCPKCGTAVLIHAPPEGAPAPEERIVPDIGQESLPVPDLPQELDRSSRYLICDSARLIACWQNDSRGWMLKTNAGLVSARRNRDMLPPRGDFRLVELTMDVSGETHRLRGLRSYQLASSWALTTLDKADHLILSKITGRAGLNHQQKETVRQAIRDQLMHPVWADARNVLDFLANTDYHTPGTE